MKKRKKKYCGREKKNCTRKSLSNQKWKSTCKHNIRLKTCFPFFFFFPSFLKGHHVIVRLVLLNKYTWTLKKKQSKLFVLPSVWAWKQTELWCTGNLAVVCFFDYHLFVFSLDVAFLNSDFHFTVILFIILFISLNNFSTNKSN